jgi:hypothetical protein
MEVRETPNNPAQRRPFSRLGLVFTAMFAVAVPINRPAGVY